MRKLALPALLSVVFCAGALTGSLLVDSARAEPQPAMRAALHNLRQAENSLEKASADKGGHRVKALQLVRSAIEEVQAGIKFDNKR